jgi:hypothetical protein
VLWPTVRSSRREWGSKAAGVAKVEFGHRGLMIVGLFPQTTGAGRSAERGAWAVEPPWQLRALESEDPVENAEDFYPRTC